MSDMAKRWSIILVGLLGAAALVYVAVPRPPESTTGGEPQGSEGAQVVEPRKGPPLPPSAKKRLPAITPDQLRKATRKAPKPIPAAARTLLSKGNKALDARRPVDVSDQYPLEDPGLMTHFDHPGSYFSIDVPTTWKTVLAQNPKTDGPLFSTYPPEDPSQTTHAAVYLSQLPISAPGMVFEKMVQAVKIRGERLVRARWIKDHGQIGFEIVSEIDHPDGPLLQRNFVIQEGSRVLNLLVKAPKKKFERLAPQFYAMARSMKFGSRVP